MSSWSRRVKTHGLKSSIEVQLSTVDGNLKKILYSCFCGSFVSCYCVLMEKMDEYGCFVTIAHFPVIESDHFSSPSVSFGDLKVWPGGLLQTTVLPSFQVKSLSAQVTAQLPHRAKMGLGQVNAGGLVRSSQLNIVTVPWIHYVPIYIYIQQATFVASGMQLTCLVAPKNCSLCIGRIVLSWWWW